MHCAVSLDTDPATWSRGTRTRARTTEWDMTAEHAVSCLCDELKRSVDESGRLDDAKQSVCNCIAAKMMSPDQENPPSPYIYSACLPTSLTIPRTFDTPSWPLLPHRFTLDNIFNTPEACLREQAFDIHHSIIDHCWEPKMWWDAFWLLKSVVADANTIQMTMLQVRVWAENARVGVSQWAAETMGICQDKGGLTTQQINNKVRERVWEIAPSMSIIN